jgi:hypothetical protein
MLVKETEIFCIEKGGNGGRGRHFCFRSSYFVKPHLLTYIVVDIFVVVCFVRFRFVSTFQVLPALYERLFHFIRTRVARLYIFKPKIPV